MDPDSFKAALRERFGAGSFIEGAPPDPVAIFLARDPEIGDVKIWIHAWDHGMFGGANALRVSIGDFFSNEFINFDTHLNETERSRRLTADVLRFLDKLFADQLLLWRRVQDRFVSKWRECNAPDSFEPIAIDNEEYAIYLWSGPQGTWRLVPAILKRGFIRGEREREALRNAVEAPGLSAVERDLAMTLLERQDDSATG